MSHKSLCAGKHHYYNIAPAWRYFGSDDGGPHAYVSIYAMVFDLIADSEFEFNKERTSFEIYVVVKHLDVVMWPWKAVVEPKFQLSAFKIWKNQINELMEGSSTSIIYIHKKYIFSSKGVRMNPWTKGGSIPDGKVLLISLGRTNKEKALHEMEQRKCMFVLYILFCFSGSRRYSVNSFEMD